MHVSKHSTPPGRRERRPPAEVVREEGLPCLRKRGVDGSQGDIEARFHSKAHAHRRGKQGTRHRR